MANRRMFAKEVVETDDFLDMGQGARLLYYDLGIQADDHGFVQPKRIMRMTGASEDDLRVLIAKKFVLPFESGVIVIRHWKKNNYLQTDRLKDTLYQEELSQLRLNQGVYHMDTECIQNVSQNRLEENRLEESRLDKGNGYQKFREIGKQIKKKGTK